MKVSRLQCLLLASLLALFIAQFQLSFASSTGNSTYNSTTNQTTLQTIPQTVLGGVPTFSANLLVLPSKITDIANYSLLGNLSVTPLNSSQPIVPFPISINYPCGIPTNSVAPYRFSNHSWTVLSQYSVNLTSCTFIFQTTDLNLNLSVISTKAAPAYAPNYYSVFELVAIVILVAALIIYRSKHGHARGNARARTGRRFKGQSAIEYLFIFAIALLILAAVISLTTGTLLNSKVSTYTPTSCFITAQIRCVQLAITSNSVKSIAVVQFVNTQTIPMSFTQNSLTVLPTTSERAFTGSCYPANALPGTTVTCIANLTGFNESLGTQLEPRFQVSFIQCVSNTCARFNTTGTSNIYVSPAISLYRVTLLASPSSGEVSINGNPYLSGSVVYFNKGTSYATYADAPPGYTFSSWTTSGGANVTNQNRQTTSSNATSNGTITAVFTRQQTTSTVSPTSTSTTPTILTSSSTSTSSTSTSSTSTTTTTHSTSSSSTSSTSSSTTTRSTTSSTTTSSTTSISSSPPPTSTPPWTLCVEEEAGVGSATPGWGCYSESSYSGVSVTATPGSGYGWDTWSTAGCASFTSESTPAAYSSSTATSTVSCSTTGGTGYVYVYFAAKPTTTTSSTSTSTTTKPTTTTTSTTSTTTISCTAPSLGKPSPLTTTVTQSATCGGAYVTYTDSISGTSPTWEWYSSTTCPSLSDCNEGGGGTGSSVSFVWSCLPCGAYNVWINAQNSCGSTTSGNANLYVSCPASTSTTTTTIPSYVDDDSCESVVNDAGFNCWAGTVPSGYKSYDCISISGSCYVIGFSTDPATAGSNGACLGTIIGGGQAYMVSGSSTASPYVAGQVC